MLLYSIYWRIPLTVIFTGEKQNRRDVFLWISRIFFTFFGAGFDFAAVRLRGGGGDSRQQHGIRPSRRPVHPWLGTSPPSGFGPASRLPLRQQLQRPATWPALRRLQALWFRPRERCHGHSGELFPSEVRVRRGRPHWLSLPVPQVKIPFLRSRTSSLWFNAGSPWCQVAMLTFLKVSPLWLKSAFA